jgi:hypothetical protein
VLCMDASMTFSKSSIFWLKSNSRNQLAKLRVVHILSDCFLLR